MVSLSDAARTAIERAIIKFGEKANFVIYPFGEDGKILKGIMNYEYNIKELAIIDNKLVKYIDGIEDVSFLKNMKML